MLNSNNVTFFNNMLFKSMYNLFLKNEHRMLISIYNKSYMMKHWAGHSARSYSNDFQMTWLIKPSKALVICLKTEITLHNQDPSNI